jgi:nitroimidazol reductase NimA-like FMN-containing flavoprotein (pyridoxamine 5'-phosphate oxidase superfamily)
MKLLMPVSTIKYLRNMKAAEVRRKDRVIDKKETLSIVENAEYGVLSVVSPDNSGYGIPLSFILMNNAIYFHCATEGKKLDSIQNNNRVSFSIVGKTEVLPEKFGTKYESAIIFGSARLVSDATEKKAALNQFLVKYSPDFIDRGKDYIEKLFDKTQIIRLEIESITGKARKQ